MADLTQTAANVGLTDVAGGSLSMKKAGEALTQGMPVYQNSSDLKYYKTDSDAIATAVAAGICLTPAAADEYFALAESGTTVDVGATLTIGTTYIVSNTAGAIAPIADLSTGEYLTILGSGTAADQLEMALYITNTASA